MRRESALPYTRLQCVGAPSAAARPGAHSDIDSLRRHLLRPLLPAPLHRCTASSSAALTPAGPAAAGPIHTHTPADRAAEPPLPPLPLRACSTPTAARDGCLSTPTGASAGCRCQHGTARPTRSPTATRKTCSQQLTGDDSAKA